MISGPYSTYIIEYISSAGEMLRFCDVSGGPHLSPRVGLWPPGRAPVC